MHGYNRTHQHIDTLSQQQQENLSQTSFGLCSRKSFYSMDFKTDSSLIQTNPPAPWLWAQKNNFFYNGEKIITLDTIEYGKPIIAQFFAMEQKNWFHCTF